MNDARARELLEGPLSVIGVGLDNIVEGARAAGAAVHEVEFSPPAGGERDLMRLLEELHREPLAKAIDEANAEALARFLESQPALVGVGRALDEIPGMAPDLFLHAGPPIEWERMSGPLRGAVIGGLLHEGMARKPDEAALLAASGRVRFAPCHHHHAVGPMAGVVTPSMPVWIVEDRSGRNAAFPPESGGRHKPPRRGGDVRGGNKGNRTYATLNEGLGKVLRYGAYNDEVLERLRFMGETLAPVLSRALESRGSIDLKTLFAQALQMGDEGHNRNRAATSLLFRELAPAMVRTGGDPKMVARCLDFMNRNDHFFLNLSMPMAKCMLMAAEGIARSSMVTVMARNGTDFGIRLASMPERWFTGPAQAVEGLYFPGFGAADANPDIGDSAITETAGFGGFAMAAAPAIVQFVGGSVEDALATSRSMARITAGRNPAFAIPALGFAGTATGIDVRKVVERSLLPVINTGIAHREAGVGQVGAGLVRPPWVCFHEALKALVEHCRNP